MLTIKSNYQNIFLIIISLVFASCNKENSIGKIESFTVRSNEHMKDFTTEDNQFIRGTYFHYSILASDPTLISSYTLSLIPDHQESTVPYYYSEYFGVENQESIYLEDSLWIPEKSGTGIYSFSIAVTNSKGEYLKSFQDILISEIYPNSIKISVDESPQSDSVYTKGNRISISGELSDVDGQLTSLSAFLVRSSDYELDPSESSICLLEKHFTPAMGSYQYEASIKVGASIDNGEVARTIEDWDLGHAYIVLKASNKNNSLLYSKHYPLIVGQQ